MTPNFENGDYLIIDEISYRFQEPQRGEVVVFKYPDDPSQRYIKRIIGLPGETLEIKDGRVVISNQGESYILDESDYLSSGISTSDEILTSLAENQYFVLGDNRRASADSRRWGSLPRENIIGRVLLRAWPFTALAKIEAPEY
jgi:signal peptidase I